MPPLISSPRLPTVPSGRSSNRATHSMDLERADQGRVQLMSSQDSDRPEPGHEFWYLLGALEEVTSAALRQGHADLDLVQHRFSRFRRDEHPALVSSFELIVVGLDFVRRFLEDLGGGRRPILRRRSGKLEELPSTETAVRERLVDIAESIEETSGRERAEDSSQIDLTESAGLALGQREVRMILGLAETAVGTIGMRLGDSTAALSARLGPLSSEDSQRLLWAVRAIEAAMAFMLLELERMVDV